MTTESGAEYFLSADRDRRNKTWSSRKSNNLIVINHLGKHDTVTAKAKRSDAPRTDGGQNQIPRLSDAKNLLLP